MSAQPWPTGESTGRPANWQNEPDDIEAWLLSDPEPVLTEAVPVTIHSSGGDVPRNETNRLRFRTAREIAASVSDEVEYAAQYLAFGAITELDGKPKAAGKTTLVLDLVRGVLDGTPFLARPTVQGPVVMLSEQPTASLRAALERAGLEDRDEFHLLTWSECAGAAWPDIVDTAASRCREVGSRILIVDTLPQFAGLRGDAENNAGDALEAIEPLQLLAAEGFAVLVTRHDRKSGGEVGDSARGSGAFTGAVDIVVALGRSSQDARPTMRHVSCLSRFSEPPADLVIELVDGHFVVLGTSAEALADALRERVLKVITEAAEPMRVTAIAEETSETEQAVRKVLSELTADHRVDRLGEGVRNDPYVFQIRPPGPIVPFVSLRETGERNESAGRAPVVEPAGDTDDYPASAWRSDDES